jgi:ADP-ribosylglycohydrolase
LIECKGFDARDQMQRYVRWWREGHLSSNGRCFDIGITVSQALTKFERTGDPRAGSADVNRAGNGSLMRLAPVPMFFAARNDADPVAMCAESSVTTHATPVAVDACRYFGALLVAALNGASKAELVGDTRYEPRKKYWDASPLHQVIAEIADGSYKRKEPPAIQGTGYSAHSLEAALWAFHKSASFEEGCLLAANLGNDADTTAAVFGQLAGAFYGKRGIPARWRERLAKRETIERFADGLMKD